MKFLWKTTTIHDAVLPVVSKNPQNFLNSRQFAYLQKTYTLFSLWENNPRLKQNFSAYINYNNSCFINKMHHVSFFFNNKVDFFHKNHYTRIMQNNVFNLKQPVLTYSPENTDLFTLNSFLFLKNSSFITFFINNLIDTPSCFKKITSLKRKNNELPFLKLINFFMKKGKKEQYTIFFFKALSFFYQHHATVTNFKIHPLPIKNNFFENYSISFFKKNNYDWKDLYLTLNNVFNYYNFEIKINLRNFLDFSYPLNYNNELTSNNKLIKKNFYIKNFLYKNLSNTSPLFNFFIYNVDKNVRKHSRNKSGKYTFVWKYVTLYKRLFIAMKLIVKDIKFSEGLKLQSRLHTTLTNLFLNPQNTFLWKSKNFTYNYVFKNYRQTLMTTLKTIR